VIDGPFFLLLVCLVRKSRGRRVRGSVTTVLAWNGQIENENALRKTWPTKLGVSEKVFRWRRCLEGERWGGPRGGAAQNLS